jgi:hypothetical protein
VGDADVCVCGDDSSTSREKVMKEGVVGDGVASDGG